MKDCVKDRRWGEAMAGPKSVLHILSAALVGGLGLPSPALAIEPGFRVAAPLWPVRLSQWPRTAPRLRIAMLSDIHAVRPWMPAERIARIASVAMAAGPDLILLLGDYVTSMSRRYRGAIVPVAEWAQALGTLRAPLGVYAVLGNHDWWDDVAAIRAGLQAAGLPVLENEAVRIEKDGFRFWLGGLGDQLAYGRRVRGRRRGVDDLERVVAQATGDDPLILMAHEPDIFAASSPRVALQLSGHTHGGQVRFPVFGAPVVPSAYGQRYAYGHIVEDGRNLVVSAGLGVSGLPVRFLAPPEITFVEVQAAEPA